MRRGLIIAGFLTAAIVAAGYAELIADIRGPHSALEEQHVIGSNVSFLTADYDRVRALMKQRYGERAVTKLDGSTGQIEVEIDNRRVHEERFPLTIENIFGAIFIGPNGSSQEKFPFDITPGRIPASPDSLASFTSHLKRRFSKTAGAALESVNESDWSHGPCKIVEPVDLGFGRLAAVLRMEAATRCLSAWKGPRLTTALFLLVQARADPWMRPFSQKICRVFGARVLRDIDPAETPDYFGCILVDRPERTGAREILTSKIFQVGPNRTLALLN